MAFFKGQELHSIDNKGRVNIPAKMRRSISPDANDTFTVTRGQDDCIVAYPLDEWKNYEEKFEELNQYDSKNRFFLRKILMWSEEVLLDAQQRIMLPKKLTDFAGIEGKVLIVGMVDHIEFWNPEKFEEYLNNHDESYEEVAAKVMVK
ncbi:MAG: division/cell wall cluster transcriptional repressor MraZ [Desulfobulbaceae bacterium]|jgi:MraZ protein|nr:division/cell wall cluster transcriptional repressor MraZ [Candidatus Kapabacteria bacterium]MBS3999231.1 division/cell wall cluster transcriptional repressor MraZ [Desulfobulbaceae bacterium]MCO5250016.1 division/cell wall cluster transcriptional repressor MraZ [Candidatus Kapabacteria bacterium]